MISILIFSVSPCGLVGRYRLQEKQSPEDGDIMFLRNVCIRLKVHTASRLITWTSSQLENFRSAQLILGKRLRPEPISNVFERLSDLLYGVVGGRSRMARFWALSNRMLAAAVS
jgi:hypothetical protein